jgi:hypothetical protein
MATREDIKFTKEAERFADTLTDWQLERDLRSAAAGKLTELVDERYAIGEPTRAMKAYAKCMTTHAQRTPMAAEEKIPKAWRRVGGNRYQRQIPGHLIEVELIESSWYAWVDGAPQQLPHRTITAAFSSVKSRGSGGFSAA